MLGTSGDPLLLRHHYQQSRHHHQINHLHGLGLAPGLPDMMTSPGGRTVPLEMHRFRQPARIVSIIDAIFCTSLLVFHGLTLMSQEIPADNRSQDNWLLPRVPMTPGELTITGYMEVIAWIGIFGVNFTQLLIAVGLFNGCDKNTEALKAFESTRVYIKTTIFIITILFTKLCILYFMHQMEMYATGTVVFTAIETSFHIGGVVIVFKFFDEIKTNYPTITEIYLTPNEDSSPKVNPVSDAVWF
ncbi:unnamed protein product [Allacma fusca]|uniref:Uncharacterized protein n=1 Tax=Allacma fusca TaxID=39272 RepID=A0A8J2KM31_9HEXA|nr:unnamed protein product [Allacma fusca]